MVYISKNNISKLLDIKIIHNPQSWLEKLLKRRSFPSNYQSLGLLFLFFSYFTIQSSSFPNSLELKSIASLTLPLSFIFFTCAENKASLKDPNDSTQLYYILQMNFWTTFYTNLLALCYLHLISEEISKILFLSSVHTLLYVSSWANCNTQSIYSSMSSFKIPEMNLLLILSFLLQIIIINPPFAILSTTIIMIFIYSGTNLIQQLVKFLLNTDQESISKLAPCLMSNINLLFWSNTNLFSSFSSSIFILHSVLNTLITYKLKVFSIAKEPFAWVQIEVLVECLFIMNELVLNQIPTHPTYLLICAFVFLRCFSLYFSVSKQLKSFFRLV